MFGNVGEGREGDPSLGIDEDLVETIVAVVAAAAARARPVLMALRKFDENGVSVEVYKHIRHVQADLRVRSVEFHPEGILIGPGKLAPTRYRGRIDFLVKTLAQFGDYDRYFGIECKLLRAGQPSKTRYYAHAGIGKFVDGTYSPGHPMAMLVGYVLDPCGIVSVDPLQDAMEGIGRSMAKHYVGASPLDVWRGEFPDALVRANVVPRGDARPIRLLHAMLRMYP